MVISLKWKPLGPDKYPSRFSVYGPIVCVRQKEQ